MEGRPPARRHSNRLKAASSDLGEKLTLHRVTNPWGRSPGSTEARAVPSLTEGVLEAGKTLRITVASDRLVVFGDGMEDDRLTASWGQKIRVQVGERPLRLVV